MSPDSSTQPPIFILGVSQRSGTNYLSQLIRQHPSCRAPEIVWEDFLVCHSDLLISYANAVFKRWRWKSGIPGRKVEEEMLSSIGDGLLHFLSSSAPPARLVTKTPDVSNINNFFRLFPRAYLIVLVRDGRAVVESRVKTFHESYDMAIHKWLAGAKSIISFEQHMQHHSSSYLIVKYEDLWNDVASELRRIFRFCDLNAESYDYKTAQEQPILGSSEYRGNEHAEVHWEPVAKSSDFNPTDRWRSWGRKRHELFNHLAGEQMERFGYELQRFNKNEALWNPVIRAISIKSRLNYIGQLAARSAKRAVIDLLRNERTVGIRRALTSGRSR